MAPPRKFSAELNYSLKIPKTTSIKGYCLSRDYYGCPWCKEYGCTQRIGY